MRLKWLGCSALPPLRRSTAHTPDAAGAISIEPFQSKQEAVQSLVLTGLAEHWGEADPALNPDLDDIAASYKDATFLVAWLDGRIVGSGALVPRSDQTAEIVRMSVASEYRRQEEESGFRRIVLETTSTWDDVIRFYEGFGFRVTHRRDGRFGGEVHFELAAG